MNELPHLGVISLLKTAIMNKKADCIHSILDLDTDSCYRNSDIFMFLIKWQSWSNSSNKLQSQITNALKSCIFFIQNISDHNVKNFKTEKLTRCSAYLIFCIGLRTKLWNICNMEHHHKEYYYYSCCRDCGIDCANKRRRVVLNAINNKYGFHIISFICTMNKNYSIPKDIVKDIVNLWIIQT